MQIFFKYQFCTFISCFGTSLASRGILDMSPSTVEAGERFLLNFGVEEAFSELFKDVILWVVLWDDRWLLEFVVPLVLLPLPTPILMPLPRAGRDLECTVLLQKVDFSFDILFTEVGKSVRIIGVLSSSGDSSNIWMDVRWGCWLGLILLWSCTLLLLWRLLDAWFTVLLPVLDFFLCLLHGAPFSSWVPDGGGKRIKIV